MGRVGILAAAWWTASAACAWGALSVPSPYLEQQRCLAVLNVATAVFQTAEPLSFAPDARERVVAAHDRLHHKISGWSGLTAQQADKGVDHFEDELDHWLAAFGDANEEDMRMAFIEALFARAERCMTLVGH